MINIIYTISKLTVNVNEEIANIAVHIPLKSEVASARQNGQIFENFQIKNF
jgi:hypothetical protein